MTAFVKAAQEKIKLRLNEISLIAGILIVII